jgi:hypothetical protein
LARIGAPRSACSVRIFGVICCCSVACSINALASSAFSCCWTVQPTMYRLNTSRVT